jgi:hypothetical protein
LRRVFMARTNLCGRCNLRLSWSVHRLDPVSKPGKGSAERCGGPCHFRSTARGPRSARVRKARIGG